TRYFSLLEHLSSLISPSSYIMQKTSEISFGHFSLSLLQLCSLLEPVGTASLSPSPRGTLQTCLSLFFFLFADKPRMNNILTSATEPYDLSFSRSFQNLSHLPPSYESAVKTNPSKYSSLKRLTDKEADEYYMRRRHLPDLAARGTLPINVIKMSQQGNQRDRPRRPIRAMSQDRVLSPERIMPEEFSMSYERILSDEQLLSAERLHSQDPLLSPERSAYPEQSMSRALSHTDVFVSTPVLDRYRMSKLHSHPSASNNLYNTLGMNPTSAKRQAFASRRHNTVEQLHYIPGHHHHYRTASKTEVTV
uniref:Shisa family member 6 n=1 Tax=Zonotrichia albicollis TaxID=44394 RepID=A0A8D2NA92_ZONAL